MSQTQRRRYLPPLHWLRAFESAARLGSFTRAADELHVTQSAVSQQVKLLEHYLGSALFRRRPQSLVLTDQGNALLPTLTRAFDQVGATAQQLFGEQRQRERLTLRVNTSFAGLWLSQRLPRFRARHPEVGLRLQHAFWSPSGEDEAADIDIGYGAGDVERGRVEPLTRETRFPVADPASAARLQSAEGVLAQPLIEVVGNEVGWVEWSQQALEEPGDIVPALQLEASIIAYELARAGGGVVLAHRTLVARFLREGSLQRLPGPEVETSEAFYLVTEHRLSGAVDKLWTWLLEESAPMREPS